jgi:hypothetical protein
MIRWREPNAGWSDGMCGEACVQTPLKSEGTR